MYFNCSYNGSSVGFMPGTISETETPDDSSYLRLNSENVPGWVKRSFESGKIQKISGLLPGKDNSYVIMRKRINDFVPDMYINFLFVFDKLLFDNFIELEKSDKSNKKLYSLLTNMISVKIEDTDFGYVIKKEGLDEFTKYVNEYESDEKDHQDTLMIKGSAKNSEEIMRILDISNDYELTPSQKAGELMLKKKAYPQTPILGILIVVLLGIFLICLLLETQQIQI